MNNGMDGIMECEAQSLCVASLCQAGSSFIRKACLPMKIILTGSF